MRSHRTRRFLSRNQFRRTTAITGLTGILMVSGVAYAGLATADVSADDSRATVVQGNINACPAGQATLVDGGTSTTTQNGITVTVSHLATSQPNPFPAGGVTTLPAGTAVLNITLPAGTTLSGDTYVKGADGYNDYPGQYGQLDPAGLQRWSDRRAVALLRLRHVGADHWLDQRQEGR